MAFGATPLVLPNNFTWNEQTGECKTDPEVQRKTLHAQKKALDQLREIKGDVCVVSIAGPCRQGKSYILSKVFDQGQVFPLGHELVPETMGIWMWVVPEKMKDTNGREFTVVLLDSEGIDAVSGEGANDNSVFTLSVLLSSTMIYNCVGRPGRSDLEGLDFIVKLSQRIELHTNATEQDDKRFYEAFPFFLWLLRDLLLDLPAGCNNLKEYFTKEVFNVKSERHTDKSRKTAESILAFFSGFDAFFLPPPSVNPKVVKNLEDEVNQVNPEFIKRIKEFKTFLYPMLSPKKSINKGEFVTGEALAVLVELYIEALNTPGVVPNVQNAWDTFVDNKCSRVLDEVLEEYKEEMTPQVENKLPCDADEIRAVHDKVMEKCFDRFNKETFSLSIKSVDKYLGQLMEKTNPILSNWLYQNKQETEKYCHQLIRNLKKTILDPLLVRLRSPERSNMTFADLVAAYDEMQEEYKISARGAKEVQATVFMDIHPELQKDMKDNIGLLEKFKDFDKSVAKEKDQKAALEKRILLIEENNARLEQDRKSREREMDLIQKKHEEEKKRLQEITEKVMKDQRDQLVNMMQANIEEIRQDREEQIVRQGTLETQIAAMSSKMEELNLQQEKKCQEINALKEDKDEEIRQLQKEGYEKMIQLQNETHEKMMQIQSESNTNLTQQQQEFYEITRQQQEEIEKLKRRCIIS